VLAVVCASAQMARAAGVSDDQGRFARDLRARQERFVREGARPHAVVPLLGVITDLWDVTEEGSEWILMVPERSASRS